MRQSSHVDEALEFHDLCFRVKLRKSLLHQGKITFVDDLVVSFLPVTSSASFKLVLESQKWSYFV